MGMEDCGLLDEYRFCDNVLDIGVGVEIRSWSLSNLLVDRIRIIQ